MKFIVGKKIGMTRVFDDEGRHISVSKIAAMPTVVSQIKTKERDNYQAIQVKALKSKDRIAKVTEFFDDAPGRYKVGQKLSGRQFKKDELVTVIGTSKGKSFAGTIKRHGFKRGPETHGSNNVREPGSIGGGYPQRVVLGRRMAGRLGGSRATVKNLKVIDVDDEIILLAGAVPGPNKSFVKIFGRGEVAEEEIDYIALEEKRAKEEMLEAEKEEKENDDETQMSNDK